MIELAVLYVRVVQMEKCFYWKIHSSKNNKTADMQTVVYPQLGAQ